MEIEDLKDIWKKQSEGFKPKNEAELATMLKGKSKSIVSRLKRNVWFELISTFLGAAALLAYASALPQGPLKWTSIVIPVLIAIYSIYYLKKLRLLNKFDSTNENLRTSLKKLVDNLNSYLLFYKRSCSVLYLVFFFLGLLFTAIEHGATSFLHKVTRPEVYLILVPGAIVFFIFSTWLTSWYLKKLYGNHLKNLEGLLRELEG